MQYPGAGAVAQAALTHAVKKELEEPDGAGQRRKEVVIGKGGFLVRIISESLVAGIQDHTPDKIRG